MKKLMVAVFLLGLTGCYSPEPDKYDAAAMLFPEQVVELHKVCQTQPDYSRSRVVIRNKEARGVICVYRDKEPSKRGGLSEYEVDAKILQIKIEEGLR